VTRVPDPIYAFQMNLIRRFRPGLWLSLDANYYRGGRSRIGDRLADDLQRDSRIGASLMFPIRQRNSLKISVATGSLNDSDEDFRILSVSLNHLF
jgi:hypothetical protein